MTKRRLKSMTLSALSHRRSRVRQALYEEDLARARQQTPAEKLKIALELSEVCFKLRRRSKLLEKDMQSLEEIH